MPLDVIVVGGGVFGLSLAYAARRAGLSVRLLEAGRVGGGASGGPVGALVPHAPGRWSELQAFQLAALDILPDWIARIEKASGRKVGYARHGRLTPLATEEARARAKSDAEAAPFRWGGAGRLELLDDVPADGRDWLAPDAAPYGMLHETLSARVDPPALLAALSACLGEAVIEGVAARIDPGGPAALTEAGRISARHLVIAAGWQSWRLVAPLAPGLAGSAVKGQAALLAAAPGPRSPRPLITAPGLFIVPHRRGVAVGSTSEPDFKAAGTDERLDDLVGRARALCPAIRQAPVVERWAGLRPRPPGRFPVAGPLPGRPGLWIAGGGYRIGLGIAHALADALVAEMTGGEAPVPLPAAFRPTAG